MKKIVSILLVLMMVLCMVSASAEVDKKDAVTITILRSGARPMNEYTDMTRQQVIDDIGVDMDLIEVDSSNFSQQLGLLVADGKMPDLVWLKYSAWQQYAADGAWADISSYLNAEDYPDLMKFVPEE